MKPWLLLIYCLAALGFSCHWNLAQAQTNAPGSGEKAAPPAKGAKNNVDFSAGLAAVTAELKAKFDQGKINAAELQESLTNINALILKHVRDGNREQLARLYLLAAHTYASGLNDQARAEAIWGQVMRSYPGTLAARAADESLLAPVKDLPEGLEVGQQFPDFTSTDVAGSLLSVSEYRGRVTMIDFWATWCGPCRGEKPNVIATYQRYHAHGFEIIGVSLDQDQESLVNFVRTSHMPWLQEDVFLNFAVMAGPIIFRGA
jgi:thiol-disulfide isomerase/thioredoxin